VFIAQVSGSAELRACFFCSANERYELLATEIRTRYGNKLSQMDVLEFDPHSPLRKLLSKAKSHTRTFYDPARPTEQLNGAIFADITDLGFPDESFDLIVSSDVLEHVPELEKALGETMRVLKPGGAHLFTVPPRSRTHKRATISDGRIIYFEPPEYHLDPLSPQGILAFWDIGPDFPSFFSSSPLSVKVARGPAGDEGRVVWIAEPAARMEAAFPPAVHATLGTAQAKVTNPPLVHRS
jgi:SAM-dependent methyltransferase